MGMPRFGHCPELVQLEEDRGASGNFTHLVITCFAEEIQ